MPKLTKKDFVQAAKLIHKHGLTKNLFGREEIGFCALGALRAAWHYASFGASIFDYTLFPAGIFPAAIAAYNDNKRRTAEEVQTLLLLLGEMAAHPT